IPIMEEKIVESESTTPKSKVTLIVDTTDVPVTEDVTLVPVTEILESNSSAINVAVTEVPIETSTGIIAGIVAHGSTIESIPEKNLDNTTVTDLQQTTSATESAVTSVINNAFVPVIITNDKNNTEADETTTITVGVNVENLAKSTLIPVTAETADATTIIAKTVTLIESTTASIVENSPSEIPIAPLGEGQIVVEESTTSAPKTEPNIGSTALQNEISATTVAAEITEKVVTITEQVQQTTESDAVTVENAHQPMGVIAEIIAHGSTVAPVIQENATITSVVTEAPIQIVTTAETNKVETSTINEKIVPVIISDNENVAESSTIIPKTSVSTEDNILPSTITVINAENIDTAT
uniref:Uncharacterized protein n=1 Tax=Panagrolaimus sp. PS1159 TaxID=55785 RepID=A0AC35F6N5_9BILA